MGRGCGTISILLWFLFAPCYHGLVEPIDDGGNPPTKGKNAAHLVPKPFRVAPGAKFTNEGGNTISHYAMWHTEPGNYHGLRAEMSIWGSPNQQPSQDSGSAIQIYCQDGGHYSLIEAGFHVSPPLYHNRDVRFFTYSTDPNSGDWVLYRHDLDTPSFLGHFSKELCPHKVTHTSINWICELPQDYIGSSNG
uniref:Uncharacterized protein n=1 Tax=Avena sativa TaxID=4498 RepID=A0ACD5YUR3_AVESA